MRSRSLLMVLVGALVCVACGDGAAGPPEATTTTVPETTTTSASDAAAEPWTERDLVYATRISDGVTVTLDIHFPADPVDAPIVIEGEEEWVDLGMIVVKRHEDDALRLAVGPEEMVADRESVRTWAELYGCATRLARVRAAELGNAAPKVIVSGFSLMGGVATQFGLFGETLDRSWDEFAAAGGPPRQLECAAASGSTHVDAIIGVAGTYDLSIPAIDGTYGSAYQQERDPEMQEFLTTAIGSNPEVVVRLIHGTNDEVPAEYADEFASLLSYAGMDAQLTTWPGEHEWPPDDVFMPILMEVVEG